MSALTQPRYLVPAVAAGSLIMGFAVAQGTGMRWLGAVVLVAGGCYCLVVMLPRQGARRTAALAAVYLISFVVSHPLGAAIGTWASVVLVASVTGAVGYALMSPIGKRVSTTESVERSTR